MAQTDSRTYIAGGLGAIGLLAAAAMGYVHITTPEAAKCATDLARAETRIELHDEAMEACKTALQVCAQSTQE